MPGISDLPLRDIACTVDNVCGKLGYPNVLNARAALLLSWKRGYSAKSFYKCPKCGYFHLTSLPPSNQWRRI